ncbi:hypothetical protein QUB80_12025 [Chlorogloeopsis sp. ULAP01]|uniref:hypothetical protein n=1 Tax=Chlorogloeopsis sp. ULAP01 TaxID=3056483 RepID=UPI0025AB3384|nr:hypothetical protein [Chlorogloeopsis sp. ULAP01]MDM9381429.1 hypothetical protein [Chlorogloeopsis sp. ULAP01]
MPSELSTCNGEPLGLGISHVVARGMTVDNVRLLKCPFFQIQKTRQITNGFSFGALTALPLSS